MGGGQGPHLHEEDFGRTIRGRGFFFLVCVPVRVCASPRSPGNMASPLTSADDEALIEEILARLTLREKLGQMMQPDWRTFRSAPKLSEAGAAVLPAWAGSAVKRALNAPLTDEQCDRSVGRHCLGSVLGGGGACPTPNEPLAWQAQAAAMQRAALRASSGLPLLVCNDSVHGQACLDATPRL